MNLKQELTDQLELNQEAKFFMFIEDQMFSKRESEMLQHYIIEHGKMPKTNQEMEDLFKFVISKFKLQNYKCSALIYWGRI